MHELSLAGAIVDTAVGHADGRRVVSVQLRVGHLRQVVPRSLSFYFEHVARGTACEGARLELEEVPAALSCASCEHRWLIDAADFRCPQCGGEASVVAGNELEVQSIEVEDEEVPCTV